MRNGSDSGLGDQVAVLTLRTPQRGLEREFEAALHDFISASFETEGQLGVHVVRPAPGTGSREYGIVRRFRDTESRDRFYRSPLFEQWEQKVARLTEGRPLRQQLTGLEAWFSLPAGSAIGPPPRWKMAVVTAAGVWPVSIFVPWLLRPLIQDLHPWFRALFIAIGIVILLTWVVMPLLVKMLTPWLQTTHK